MEFTKYDQIQDAAEEVVEQIKEKKWDNALDFCTEGIKNLFNALEEITDSRVVISASLIEDFASDLVDANKQNTENVPSNINALIKVACMATCESRKAGKEDGFMLQDKFLIQEDTEEQSNETDFVGTVLENQETRINAENPEFVKKQLQKLIPNKCEEYFPQIISVQEETTDIQILNIAYQEKLNTLLLGEAGCGKTLSLKRLAFELGVPYKSVSLNGACTVEDLIGHYTRVGAEWAWVDGWLTKLARHGGIFVAEEINAAPPEILFILHDLLGHVTRKIDLTQAGGEVVHANEEFFFAATANPDYDGTNTFNKALKDRFDVVLEYFYDVTVEQNFIRDKNLLKFASMLRKKYPNEISQPISSRSLKQFENNRSLYGYDTAKTIYINRFPKNEQNLVIAAFESTMA
jgi:MoxR-like ATPase